MINQDPFSSHSAAEEAGPTRPAANSVTDTRIPQTLGGVFDEAFDLYKRHFITLALLTAIIYLPVQFAMHAAFDTWLLPLTKEMDRSTDMQAETVLRFMAGVFFTGVPQAGVPGFFTLLATVLVSGPVTFAVSKLYVGETVTVREAYRAMKGRWSGLLGGWFLTGVAFVVAFGAALVVVLIGIGLMAAALSHVVPSEVLSIIALVSMIVPYGAGCAAVGGWFAFTSQLVTLEGLPVSDVSGRNWALVGKRRFWRTLGAIFGLPLVLIGLQSLILLSIQTTAGNLKSAPAAEFVMTCTLSAATAFFFTPYPIIFLTLLYYDTRIRREGLDVRMLSDSVPTLEGGVAMRSASPVPVNVPAPSPTITTSSGPFSFMEPGPAAPPPPSEPADIPAPRTDTEAV